MKDLQLAADAYLEGGFSVERLFNGTYVGDLQATDTGLSTAMDAMWLLVSGALVMFMQAGFAILESGACREKNAAMVLMKNVLDACLGGLVWYVLGYGLAYGAPAEPSVFIGQQNFAGVDFEGPGA